AQVVGQRVVVLLLAVAEDLVAATLHPRVAGQRIFVGGAFAHAVDREQLRAHVDQLQALQEYPDLVVFDPAQWRHRAVADHAEHVAHRARPEQRQFDITRTLPAPYAQGLAEILA